MNQRERFEPAGEAASVPAELVRAWRNGWGRNPVGMTSDQYIANKAAAYGRGQSQWVPVSERLPDVVEFEDGSVNSVLVYAKGKFVSGSDWQVVSAVWACNEHNKGLYTHWMPLPEPPTC